MFFKIRPNNGAYRVSRTVACIRPEPKLSKGLKIKFKKQNSIADIPKLGVRKKSMF